MYVETNVNHRNEQGGTPLHYACAGLMDNPSCVEMLIQRGAKVNVQDHKKNTPAMVASFFNKPKILQYLIDAGADLKIKNNEDKDAFTVADEKQHIEARSIIMRCLEKNLNKANVDERVVKDELTRNFDVKAKNNGASRFHYNQRNMKCNVFKNFN